MLLGQPLRDLVFGGGSSVPSGPMYIRYDTVAGDTPASVGSAFAVDPLRVAEQGGVGDARTPLSVGTEVRIDASRLWASMTSPLRYTVETTIEGTARRFKIEPALALAVAWQESRMDQSARSETGAIGIMQVEPDTARLAAQDLGQPINAYDAADNITAGIFWLHSLLTSYNGDIASTLAAYYEGPGNLARQGYLSGTAEYVAHAEGLRRALLGANPGLGS